MSRPVAAIFFILVSTASFLFFPILDSRAAVAVSGNETVSDPGTLLAQMFVQVADMQKTLQPANEGVVVGEGGAVTPLPNSQAYAPVGISIPSIALSARVNSVGVAADGSMAVPVIPNTVGWYAAGTVPGAEGSAVLDAHVYLAFKDLKKIKTGDSIFVTGADGIARRFVVSSAKVYADAAVPLRSIFTASDAAHLNLITCAGAWMPRLGTYSERLVVYATLAA